MNVYMIHTEILEISAIVDDIQQIISDDQHKSIMDLLMNIYKKWEDTELIRNLRRDNETLKNNQKLLKKLYIYKQPINIFSLSIVFIENIFIEIYRKYQQNIYIYNE